MYVQLFSVWEKRQNLEQIDTVIGKDKQKVNSLVYNVRPMSGVESDVILSCDLVA